MQKQNSQFKNNNLPKGWRKVKLGEWIELKYGFGLPEEKRIKGDIPVYGSSGIVGYHKKPAVNTQGIIIGRKGNVGVVYFSSGPFYPIDTVYFIDSLKKDGDLKFFYYLLKTIDFKKVDINVGVPGLNRDTAHSLDILIPEDLNEQKRIADILSTFDDKIELNNKIIKTLDEMAQEVFKEWFNKNSKVKSQKSKLEGWEIKDAEEVFVFEKGIEPGSKYYSETKKEGYIPFYRVRDLDKQSGVDVYIPKEIANGKICKESDILLSLDATVGRVKIGCNGAFSSGIRKVYSKDGFIKNSFIYFWLKTTYVQNTILEHASGTTILHAGHSIKYLKFPFNKKVIEKIQSKVDPMFEKILQIMKENQKLSTIRDLLLPKLMSGEIRV
jgi:type I restriction enzyme S subunit